MDQSLNITDINFLERQHSNSTLKSNYYNSEQKQLRQLETKQQRKERYLQNFRNNVKVKNEIVLKYIPYADQLPFFFQTWLRNYIGANILYFTVGSIWCYYIYYVFREELFGNSRIPQFKDLLEQGKLSFRGFPIYTLFPTVTEMAVVNGLTQVYPEIQDVGWVGFFFYMAIYFTWVEIGGYFVHKWLHENPWAYKNLHSLHHKFNTEDTLSPFAGVAFNPFDGLCLASPYTIGIFLTPMHFVTFQIILTSLTVWTISVHDQVHAGVYPLLGGGYHAIHHIAYNYNYGNHFIFMDKFMGTLKTPEDFEKEMKELKEL